MKLKPIIYGPFTILEKIGTNSFFLDLPSYAKICSIINVENLKIYEPPMIMDEREIFQVPSIDEFSLEYLDELKEDIVLNNRTIISRKGNVDYLRVGLKGTHPSKAWWIEKEKVRELYPHLSVD